MTCCTTTYISISHCFRLFCSKILFRVYFRIWFFYCTFWKRCTHARVAFTVVLYENFAHFAPRNGKLTQAINAIHNYPWHTRLNIGFIEAGGWRKPILCSIISSKFHQIVHTHICIRWDSRYKHRFVRAYYIIYKRRNTFSVFSEL